MKTVSVLCALVFVAASANAAARLKLYVSSISPAEVIIQAIVEPAGDNRAIEAVAESDDFYRSSTIQLDGDQAPRVTSISFRQVPAGMYEVTVRVLGSEERPLATVVKWVRVP